MDQGSFQTPHNRARLLRLSAIAATGVLVVGVGGTAAGVTYLAGHQPATGGAPSDGNTNADNGNGGGGVFSWIPGLGGAPQGGQSNGGSHGS